MLAGGWQGQYVTDTLCHNSCRGMTSLGWCWDDAVPSSSNCASLQGQLCGCSQRTDWWTACRQVSWSAARADHWRWSMWQDDRDFFRRSLNLLCRDAPWKVHRRGRSWVSDEPPFWRHAQPRVAAFSAVWPRCRRSPLAVTLQHWFVT